MLLILPSTNTYVNKPHPAFASDKYLEQFLPIFLIDPFW